MRSVRTKFWRKMSILWIWATILGASALVIKVRKATPNLQVEQNRELIIMSDYLHIPFLPSIASSQCWSVGSNLTIYVGVSTRIPGTAHPGAAKITQEAWWAWTKSNYRFEALWCMIRTVGAHRSKWSVVLLLGYLQESPCAKQCFHQGSSSLRSICTRRTSRPIFHNVSMRKH